MSSKTRFKWIRALPAPGTPNNTGYFRYSLQNMRQIPTLVGSAIAGSGPSPFMTAYIPANSWALDKHLLIRGFYGIVFPGGPPVPGYDVIETIDIPNGGAITLPRPGPFTATSGVFTTWIQRDLIRVGTNIVCFDLGDCMQHNWINLDDSIEHVITVPPLIGEFDFSIPIQIDVSATLPGTFPGAVLSTRWCEAFLEQGTNLGRLP